MASNLLRRLSAFADQHGGSGVSKQPGIARLLVIAVHRKWHEDSGATGGGEFVDGGCPRSAQHQVSASQPRRHVGEKRCDFEVSQTKRREACFSLGTAFITDLGNQVQATSFIFGQAIQCSGQKACKHGSPLRAAKDQQSEWILQRRWWRVGGFTDGRDISSYWVANGVDAILCWAGYAFYLWEGGRNLPGLSADESIGPAHNAVLLV